MKLKIGIVIMYCRKYCEYKQEYMACELGLTLKAYEKIEHGHVDISVSTLTSLAKLFGLQGHQILLLAEELYEVGNEQGLSYIIKDMIRLNHIDPES
jgi:DNA-binding XRE family transcriptional regulator